MNVQVLSASGGILLAALLVGCATQSSPGRAGHCGTDYRCVSDLVIQYRQQAAELQAMADRYAAEADLRAKESGQQSASAQRNEQLAKQMWSQAQVADERARELQSQLPHGVVY